ncbi:(2Fe-2S)-binding protein [Shouchella sp. JSM 1781072]|uniref:(2Fe-2S)-binding protein n=1 Tax=Bacillaceae TaxID=186817 RepID=UPI0020D14049|nr:2Fe-2S iron-sulfur cluster-binding protein [Alkalihalobacillus sp. LMS6]UTR06760.1 2Fe-2S iron-sulfur cluster-binding protein [Alkalihalobacillus sp. LMS6]
MDRTIEAHTFELNIMLNGEDVVRTVAYTDRLVDIIRETHTGTKVSCGIGRCGACSVLMNDQLVNACLVMAYQADGAEIITIEGISHDGQDPVQQAFLEEGGFQCGYCTPGMILAVKALLIEKPKPTDEEIIQGLSGNVCRCTGYAGIIRAVKAAAEV